MNFRCIRLTRSLHCSCELLQLPVITMDREVRNAKSEVCEECPFIGFLQLILLSLCVHNVQWLRNRRRRSECRVAQCASLHLALELVTMYTLNHLIVLHNPRKFRGVGGGVMCII